MNWLLHLSDARILPSMPPPLLFCCQHVKSRIIRTMAACNGAKFQHGARDRSLIKGLGREHDTKPRTGTTVELVGTIPADRSLRRRVVDAKVKVNAKGLSMSQTSVRGTPFAVGRSDVLILSGMRFHLCNTRYTFLAQGQQRPSL